MIEFGEVTRAKFLEDVVQFSFLIHASRIIYNRVHI